MSPSLLRGQLLLVSTVLALCLISIVRATPSPITTDGDEVKGVLLRRAPVPVPPQSVPQSWKLPEPRLEVPGWENAAEAIAKDAQRYQDFAAGRARAGSLKTPRYDWLFDRELDTLEKVCSSDKSPSPSPSSSSSSNPNSNRPPSSLIE